MSLNAEGEIHFIPEPDFFGLGSFGYSVRNAQGREETITVNVTVEGVNDAADAVDDTVLLVEDTPFGLNQLLANDTDVDGDALQIVGVSQVDHGRVELNAAGEFVFIPHADYVGEVNLNYVVMDAAGARSVAHARLTYTDGGNDAPTVVNEVFYDGVEDQAYTLNAGDLLANDSDSEGAELMLRHVGLVDDAQGILSFDQAAGEITITPAPDYYGEIKLSYQVSDGEGGLSEGSASVFFSNTTDAFTTGDHAKVTQEDTVTIFTPDYFLAGVDNPGGDPIEIVAARMVGGNVGQVQVLEDGSVQFIPGPEFSGETAFEVRLSNGVDRIATRVDVTVEVVNDAPTAFPDILAGAVEDEVYEFTVSELLSNDSDIEGAALSGVAGMEEVQTYRLAA